MILKLKYLTMISSIFLFLIGGAGYAESEIPFVFEYDLPVVNDHVYAGHSVKFTHATHAMGYKITCVKCHHTLEPGAIAVEETCMDCHDNTDLRGYLGSRIIPDDKRLEYYILAIHDQCMSCHKEIKKYTKYTRVAKAPVACWGCHVREKR